MRTGSMLTVRGRDVISATTGQGTINKRRSKIVFVPEVGKRKRERL
jgi:hypothetical protein